MTFGNTLGCSFTKHWDRNRILSFIDQFLEKNIQVVFSIQVANNLKCEQTNDYVLTLFWPCCLTFHLYCMRLFFCKIKLPFENVGWNSGWKCQIWPNLIDLWPHNFTFHVSPNIIAVSIFAKVMGGKIKCLVIGHWPLTFTFEILPHLLCSFICRFLSYLPSKLNWFLAWRNSWKYTVLAMLHWPLTSQLELRLVLSYHFIFVSFWPPLPRFLDIWHFRQKLWMKIRICPA